MPEARPSGQGRAEAPSTWQDRTWTIGKQVLMFVVAQYAMRQFFSGGGQKTSAVPEVATDKSQASFEYSRIPQFIYPMWPNNASVDITMYLATSMILPSLSTLPPESLVMEERGFALERGKGDERQIQTSFAVPEIVQQNGTLWAHILVGQSGAELDPTSQSFDSKKAYWVTRRLTQYLPKRKIHKMRNLLGGSNETAAGEEEDASHGALTASYYHPNFTLSFVPSSDRVQYTTLHPAIRQFYTLDSSDARDSTGRNGYFYPVLYFNTFWQLRSQMTELNATQPVGTLPMNVRVSTLASWQFTMMSTMDEGMKESARKAARGEKTPGGGDGSEMELFKETLLNTNSWLLGTTAVVSILHMIFELLAFKSDVGHWRKKKDNVGVSVRTILSNVVMQSIILLYLVDNNDSTSWMILFGQGMGIAIEAWKITKSVNVRVREPQQGTFFHGKLPAVVVFEDKHQLSETEEKTEEYDKIAFKWMGIIAVPLLLAYAAYSLVYESHKSWYSFIITTLVGSVYAYGFLMMVRIPFFVFYCAQLTVMQVPSLYINYRLKSVAHMPARAMTYKFLNTFIDDLFAFTIKMPTLHRLATLRDDVIFFVYLYQAWAYKVDYARVNEFGQGGDENDKKEVAEDAKAADNLPKDKVDAVASSAKVQGSARKRRG